MLKTSIFIAQRQFEMLELLDGQIQFLLTECSLPQVLYYNEHYEDNICDIAKTRKQILSRGYSTTMNVFVSAATANTCTPAVFRMKNRPKGLTAAYAAF
ncbi:MAG: hypothetical protein IPN06_20785 [Burkholderiales bacterium]|nr:hypothetical protein [Burkholderiales bacterium]